MVLLFALLKENTITAAAICVLLAGTVSPQVPDVSSHKEMTMLKQATEQHPVVVTKDVICNKCGQSCRVQLGPISDDDEPTFQFVELKVLWEEEMHRSHLCEQCYNNFVATFLIPPEIREGRIDLIAEDPFANAQE